MHRCAVASVIAVFLMVAPAERDANAVNATRSRETTIVRVIRSLVTQFGTVTRKVTSLGDNLSPPKP